MTGALTDLVQGVHVSTTESTAAGGLYRKLAEVMGECGYVKKNGVNTFHKYKYVTEADLVDAVREKLAERNVVLIPSVTRVDERPYETAKGKHSVITTVHVSFTFCDGDSGETHRAEWAGSGDDESDKGLYKAYTGALKYFLMKSFLIPTGDDPDADQRSDERGRAKPAPPIPANRAAEIVALAEQIGVSDKLPLAVAHTGASSVESLTAAQAVKVDKWLQGKADEAAVAA